MGSELCIRDCISTMLWTWTKTCSPPSLEPDPRLSLFAKWMKETCLSDLQAGETSVVRTVARFEYSESVFLLRLPILSTHTWYPQSDIPAPIVKKGLISTKSSPLFKDKLLFSANSSPGLQGDVQARGSPQSCDWANSRRPPAQGTGGQVRLGQSSWAFCSCAQSLQQYLGKVFYEHHR